MAEALLELRHMHKNFGTTVALKDVSMSVYPGEIRGLIGENGSGKSTITSIASGMQGTTTGEMFYKQEPWNPSTMVEAQEKGISMILQEANTIPGCTVAENLFAGQEDRFSRLGVFQKKKMIREAEELLTEFEITHIKAEDNINSYGFEDRKLIEIVRAVGRRTEVLVVDETTTALSMEGRELLYRIMEGLAEKGKAVIFISHDLEEILSRCTVLTVLRDGEIVGEVSGKELKAQNIDKKVRHMMVGREIGDAYYREDFDGTSEKEVVLSLEGITTDTLKDFSLKLHKGEIVGIGGLSGCGMHEVGRVAFGLEKPKSGAVACGKIKIKSPRTAVENGIGYISKNRDTEALLLNAGIETNIVLPLLPELRKRSFLSPRRLRQAAEMEIVRLSIKCRNEKQWVHTLSGGNKQKVSFAKWLAKGSQIIVMDCPTRGVDIGVKQSMYRLIDEMKQAGKSILMISEELQELIGMSDRIIVMKNAEIAHEFQRSQKLKETDIVEYMI